MESAAGQRCKWPLKIEEGVLQRVQVERIAICRHRNWWRLGDCRSWIISDRSPRWRQFRISLVSSGADGSVVEAFWIVGYDDDRSHGRSSIEWLKGARQLDGRSPGSVEEHGLWHTVVPIGSLQMTYWYKFDPGEDVVIECYAPFQTCEGNVDLKDLRMYARLSFDKDAIPQHQVIVEGLRTLLSRRRTSS